MRAGPGVFFRLISFATLVLIPLSLPASAAGGMGGAAPAGPSTRLQFAMALYAAGIPLGKVDMDARYAADGYRTVSHLTTSGVVNVFWQAEIQATASGALAGRKLTPASYVSFYTGRNARHQEVSLTFENGYPAKLYANPVYPVRSYSVKPEEKRDSFDPLSAVTGIVAGVGTTGDDLCTRTLKVFDGRRRYDVVLRKLKNIDIRMDNGLYRGPGQQCEVIYRQVSGYRPHILQDAHFPKIYAWMAAYAKGGRNYTVPLRVWARTPYGTVAAVASELKFDGAAAK